MICCPFVVASAAGEATLLAAAVVVPVVESC
jgi:hypothetical protein